MDPIDISHYQLFEIAINNEHDSERCLTRLDATYPNMPVEKRERLRSYLVKTFLPQSKKRWQNVNRTRRDFELNNASWLERRFRLVAEAVEPQSSATVSIKRGRPTKDFNACCERTQRRKVKEVREEVEEQLLNKAARIPGFSPKQALGLILDNSLSKIQYENIRLATKKITGVDLFPSYNRVREEKQGCYPTGVEATESRASVPLKDLVEHTTTRLLHSQSEAKLMIMEPELRLICKWGYDGSSGHSEYKQIFADQTVSDASLFLTSLVPLQLCNRSDNTEVYWQNETPSSTRYCRPLKFEFLKETPELITAELARVEKEISELECIDFSVRGISVSVDFRMVLSMIDGKVIQILNNSKYFAECPRCRAKPREMNDLPLMYSRPCSIPQNHVALSPLHTRIKVMEHLLKIAYKEGFDELRPLGPKELKLATKVAIQKAFKEKLGLNIDKVKQGFGTSNDGNTSRRFFSDVNMTATITRLDSELIERFGVLLDTINSTSAVNILKFKEYCEQTAQRYVNLYSEHPMSNAVHRLLIHSTSIITEAPLPLGALSEEAQETQHKFYRQIRLSHARKCTRTATNADVIHHMLAASDPLINTFRRQPATGKTPSNDKVRGLLEEGDVSSEYEDP